MLEAALRASSAAPDTPEQGRQGEGWENESEADGGANKRRRIGEAVVAGGSATPSPPPGMSLPELAAIASRLAPSSRSSEHAPANGDGGARTHEDTSSSSAFHLNELTSFREGLRDDVDRMRDHARYFESRIAQGQQMLSSIERLIEQQSAPPQRKASHEAAPSAPPAAASSSGSQARAGPSQERESQPPSPRWRQFKEYIDGLPSFEAVPLPPRVRPGSGPTTPSTSQPPSTVAANQTATQASTAPAPSAS